MTLRRLSEQVKAQNWFAVGLDFFVVVAGILIAIQVTNWNEARIDRRDEARFLQQLHGDLLTAESLGRKRGAYRMRTRENMEGVLDVLMNRVDRPNLTELECASLVGSTSINVPFAELSSFSELIYSGRLNIIEDDALRADLVRLQQVTAAANQVVEQLSPALRLLDLDFPEYVALNTVVIKGQNGRREISPLATCDTQGMKSSQAFLNVAGRNIDVYDAFIRDALEPWLEAIATSHGRVDAILSIDHGGGG